ncbi:pol polyprotein, partial [Tanacetum coccineum]
VNKDDKSLEELADLVFFFLQPPPTGTLRRAPPLVQYLRQVLQKCLGGFNVTVFSTPLVSQPVEVVPAEATKGVLEEVVTTCERFQVRVSPWGFSFNVRICWFCPIYVSIQGRQRLPSGYVADRDYLLGMTNAQTPPTATTVVNTTGAPITNTVANHVEKPEKFNGQNFKRWQQKMFFYLTTLGLARFLKETAPQVKPPAEGQSSNAQDVQAVEAWKHLDFLCHNYVLNGLIDPLYNVYCKTTTAKELWESLECKYKTEDNKLAQKDTYTPDFAKANMVEHVGSSSSWDCKAEVPGDLLHAANCKMPKRVNPRQTNMVNDDVDMIAMVSDVCAMISEVNLVGTNHGGWWIDTGVTHHVCADKSMFHYFRAVDNGHKLYMGNSATADIKGEGDVVLKMTSEKELKLTNVLYVPEIRKNLVSGWLLNKFGFRLVFESDKFVLSKNQMYVGKGYAMNGMFKLNVMVVKNEINKMNSSAYLIESSNVWHARLGHVNFNSLRHLIKFNSMPNYHIDSKNKCKTCIEAKLTRTSFKLVKRTTKPLDMVHTDICDLKSLPTKGSNKHFITFIDDCTKYCYVYLLKSKDEAINKFVLYKNEVENQLGKKIKVVRSDRGGEYVSHPQIHCSGRLDLRL